MLSRLFGLYSSRFSKVVRLCGLIFIMMEVSLWSQDFYNLQISDVKDVIAELKSKNQGISNFQANFKEYSSTYNLRQGKIYIKKPDLMKIEYYYGKSLAMVVYVNPDKLYVYSVTKRLVYEQDLKVNDAEELLDSEANETTPLDANTYFVNFDYLQKNYNFNLGSTNRLVDLFDDVSKKKFNLVGQRNESAYYLRLSPIDVTRQLDSLQLWFSSKGILLRSYATSVEEKDRDMYFFDIKTEVLPIRLFDFVIPANVRLIKNILPEVNFERK